MAGAVLVAATIAGLAGGSIEACSGLDNAEGGETKILLLVTQQYGANYHLIRDILERYGWDITVTGVAPVVAPCPAYGGAFGCQPITVDTLLTEIGHTTAYDCLMIMPAMAWSGNSHYELLGSPEALAFVATAVAEDLIVAAWCGGTRVLAAADVIEGKRVCGHHLYIQEYLDAGAIYVPGSPPPVVDGNIITARRGQSYAPETCEVVAAAIDSVQAGSVHQ
jgi:hypothetical protein